MITKETYMPEQPFFQLSTADYISQLSLCDRGVAQYYSFVNLNADNDITAVPDGTIDIIIQCSGNHPRAQVCGSVKKGRQVKFELGVKYFGIRFFPGTADALLQCPLNLFTDQEVLLENVCDRADELVERISNANSFEERICFFEKYYAKRIREYSGESTLIPYLIDKINKSHGDIKVGELAEDTGYSTRHISGQFSRAVGISPKLYSRIVRFQRCLGLLWGQEQLSYASLAQDSGYYDQAHFINEFREFSLCTPAQALGTSMQ